MNYLILGKQSFVSKKGTQCNILHVAYQDDKVSGMATDRIFVNIDIFNKAEIKKTYTPVYGNNYGRAVIIDLILVSN